MRTCPRSGLHNPLKNPERYNELGAACAKASEEMRKPEVQYFYARLIQRLTPKSWTQASGEPTITRKFLENYSCDQVRYLAKSFGVAGDHLGQTSTGIRMPFGACGVITPFNFPLEICALQAMSGLFMGNRITLKVDEKVQICVEQFLRMMHHVGLPKTDIDLIYCKGPVMNKVLVDALHGFAARRGEADGGPPRPRQAGGRRLRLEGARPRPRRHGLRGLAGGPGCLCLRW